MNTLSRRDFISRAATGIAGFSLLGSRLTTAETMKGPIGFQSWIVRDTIGKDFAGTLKTMAGLGYNSIEMCSPPGYMDYGFGALQSMKAAEMKKVFKNEGFTCVSCHYGFKELKEHGQERMDYAKELGLEQMVCSSFGLPKEATLSDWKRACDDLNKIGESSKKMGIQTGFHNHNGEFSMLEGQLIYDALLKQLDPALVKMQFQVWVISIGYKAADYFRKYPGRFISAHLYDWSGKGEEQVALGKGTVDWKDFFDAAKTGGVKNYFIEMSSNLKESADFLKGF